MQQSRAARAGTSVCPSGTDSMELRTKPGYLIPLKSPIAEVLSTVDARDQRVLTFSGHLFYSEVVKFYEDDAYHPFLPRKGRRLLTTKLYLGTPEGIRAAAFLTRTLRRPSFKHSETSER